MSNDLTNQTVPLFPAALTKWSGHRGGGVRKPFFEGAGRPCNNVIKTPLLARLVLWSQNLAKNPKTTPRSIFLVGGPGNGKTEAVEQTVRALDDAFVLQGQLIERFSTAFERAGKEGSARRVDVNLDVETTRQEISVISVVQDASMSDSQAPGKSAADLFLQDVSNVLSDVDRVYLACINRGILDDALMLANARGDERVQQLLESVIQSIEIKPHAPSCWPLDQFPAVAVWPMDIESLVIGDDTASSPSPAAQVLSHAIDAAQWAPFGACAAGEKCPFCGNRKTLSREGHFDSLLKILRWSELALCKRWSFRDLFSLYSHLLAGSVIEEGEELTPCQWAAELIKCQSQTSTLAAAVKRRFKSPFLLVSALYQHALFGVWLRPNPRLLRKEISDVRMLDDPGLMGLYYFLTSPAEEAITGTLQAQLRALTEALDPALAEPDSEIAMSSRTLSFGNDIDVYFSQSVAEGLDSCRRSLHALEVDVLLKLAETDRRLSSPDQRRSSPTTARRLQGLIRDFSCRLVRRSLGVRYGCVRDQAVLTEFQKVVAGDPRLVHKAVKQVEGLLNESERFAITLNSTFGEPSLPAPRRAVLITAKQKVKAMEDVPRARPALVLRFLSIGSGKSSHTLALTYDLFRAVHELRQGLLPASLPRPVVALLDTSRSKLAGTVVRDEDILEDAEIHLGAMKVVVRRELNRFVVSREGTE